MRPDPAGESTVDPTVLDELDELSAEAARIHNAVRPIATAPVDDAAEDGWRSRVTAELRQAMPPDGRPAILPSLIALYATGGAEVRAHIRQLFENYPYFRWVAVLTHGTTTALEFRAHLLLLSARDQGADTRDEILLLNDLCTEARAAGIDTAPILTEVAALSATTDKYGMGSTRDLLLRCLPT
jgi:hypothetical protein